ncbi:MAG: hypothetical protein IKU15_00165 [Clostridia bacterium]|nr:hypothetical protein [Clostridia bacterium]
MLTLTVNKVTNRATVMFNGKEETLTVVKVNKENVKPGTHWVNMQALGCPKKWATVNYNNYEDDVFTVDVDENACRTAVSRASRMVTLANAKDFLTEEQGAQFDELLAAAKAEAERRYQEAQSNKPVKEKKSRAMSTEEKIAKKLAEIEYLKKVQSGEIVEEPKKARKSKKDVVLENLDIDGE